MSEQVESEDVGAIVRGVNEIRCPNKEEMCTSNGSANIRDGYSRYVKQLINDRRTLLVFMWRLVFRLKIYRNSLYETVLYSLEHLKNLRTREFNTAREPVLDIDSKSSLGREFSKKSRSFNLEINTDPAISTTGTMVQQSIQSSVDTSIIF